CPRRPEAVIASRLPRRRPVQPTRLGQGTAWLDERPRFKVAHNGADPAASAFATNAQLIDRPRRLDLRKARPNATALTAEKVYTEHEGVPDGISDQSLERRSEGRCHQPERDRRLLVPKLEGRCARAAVKRPPEAVLDPVGRKGSGSRAQVDAMWPSGDVHQP